MSGSPRNSFNNYDIFESSNSLKHETPDSKKWFHSDKNSADYNNIDIKEKLNDCRFIQVKSQKCSNHNSIWNSINNSKNNSIHQSLVEVEFKDQLSHEGVKIEHEIVDYEEELTKVKRLNLDRRDSDGIRSSNYSSRSDFLNLSCGKFIKKVVVNIPYSCDPTENEKETIIEKNLRKWEKILNRADIFVIKQMLEEVELNRIALFNKSIKELHQALKSTPYSFYLKFNIGIGNYGPLIKKFLPNDSIIIIKKGDFLVIEFSIIELKGILPKKRKTNLLINCKPGSESIY